ncbi:MAG TPA: Hsp70 family protein [Pirellulaceae bacterium]|nr:Hsp70 family protein [Pirellulaceae bacterium]
MNRPPVEFDPLVDRAPSRYVVGIDLGTTNSALAYVDTEASDRVVRTLAIAQLVDAGKVAAPQSLPSFLYLPEPAVGEEALRLPWSQGPLAREVIGAWARDRAAQVPGRVVVSAKSWLCHAGVNRTAPLLPWQGAEDAPRLSPVEASSRYLAHLAAAWNEEFRNYPLAEQDVTLTLPASFDEAARELTIEAAAMAGLRRIVLLEEPQAAFYAWLEKRSADWESVCRPGQKILVCDIGGGTTDFTLIRVRKRSASADAGEGDARIQFHRVAVGEHLILGGDNMDLALARRLEERTTNGGRLPPRQWESLLRRCRETKEKLLADDAAESYSFQATGGGSKLVGGSLQFAVVREEAESVVLDGFFPFVDLEEKPQRRRSGFQEFGLPYAPDPAATRYLAAFLTAHRHVATEELPERLDHDPARPDLILFNGGVLESTKIRSRIVEQIERWFGPTSPPGWRPLVLDHERLDLAVARGAAYYGLVRRGEGVRIAAGLARTYYLGVARDGAPAETTVGSGVEGDETNAVMPAIIEGQRALCMVPGNAEPGDEISLDGVPMRLTVSRPVEFPLFVSSVRLADPPGTVVTVDPESMQPLAPLRTVIRSRSKNDEGTIAVTLHVRLTEIGTLEVWLQEREEDRRSDATNPRRWRLQFDVRAALETDRESVESQGERLGILEESAWEACAAALDDVFAESGTADPDYLVARLGEALASPRDAWTPVALRRIWDRLLELEQGRKKSPKHEARWLNLCGFALRPGYGVALDDWRVSETWRKVQGKLYHGSPACRQESLVLWRRVAGGLSPGQQKAIAEPLLTTVRALHRRATGAGVRDVVPDPKETVEIWRLLGSLELLPVGEKRQLGDRMLDLMFRRKYDPARRAMLWALGRLGQRVPVYGPLDSLLPADRAEAWLAVIAKGWKELSDPEPLDPVPILQLARRTGDRHRDISVSAREKAIAMLEMFDAPAHIVRLVSEGGALDADEQTAVMGEALPLGLSIA